MSEHTELITREPARALADLLQVAPPDFDAGERLPIMWHWVYLLDRPRQSDLGSDGHPIRNATPAPPRPGLRRMFAGGRSKAFGGLRCDEPATRQSAVLRSD